MAEAARSVIARVAAVMRAIGDHEPDGASTTDIARTAGLARPTVHRMVTALAAEGFVDRHESGRWALGPETFLLGSMAAERYDITSSAGDILRDLARTTGESAFLSARRGDETVCIASEEGSFPLRSHVLHVGLRMPLGVASAGLVILAHLPERERVEYLDRAELGGWGERHAPREIAERVEQVLVQGYSVNPGLLVEGSWGLGAAVFDRRDAPAWALSLTGVAGRFDDVRRPVLGEQLLRAAHALTSRLR
ncbi:IclR family transcriptional regulator [Rhodococcus sp. BP-316]|jgi:DNA-binding IclR family transcriptional regulator|uniref:IclR family transcriptional regulator n=1 Tax=unclassified Rhodococcus (in: high G+C Gram-positive bacteria) TaxID=192944 RepID=UPI001C9B81E0|nr:MULTISPECIES: IclR family transcriptional regulator [unclassified Rhodococcus (in: high G+C Gram-positive bacteria)]MBY6680942.1 IclR family transcriptional regulator [Rhodococcus sp. BP-316]